VYALARAKPQHIAKIARGLGAQPDFSEVEISTHHVAGTVHYLLGRGGNNGLSVGDGAVGPVTRRLLQAWGDLVAVDIAAQAQRHLRHT